MCWVRAWGGRFSVLFQPHLIAFLSEQVLVTIALLAYPFGIGPCENHPTHKTPLSWRYLHISVGLGGEAPSRVVVVVVFLIYNLPLLTYSWLKSIWFPTPGNWTWDSEHAPVSITGGNCEFWEEHFPPSMWTEGQERGNVQISKEKSRGHRNKLHSWDLHSFNAWFQSWGFQSMPCLFMHVLMFPLFSLFLLKLVPAGVC